MILILFLASLTSLCHAFQNLFNVPNSQITSPQRFYFQQQINSTFSHLEGDTDLVYGLGSQWEVGAAVSNVPVSWSGDTLSQNLHSTTTGLVFGVQKKVNFGENYGIALGTKNGVGLNNGRGGHWVSRGHLHLIAVVP